MLAVSAFGSTTIATAWRAEKDNFFTAEQSEWL